MHLLEKASAIVGHVKEVMKKGLYFIFLVGGHSCFLKQISMHFAQYSHYRNLKL